MRGKHMTKIIPACISVATVTAAAPAMAHHHHDEGGVFTMSAQTFIQFGAIFLGALAILLIIARLFRAHRQTVRSTTKTR